MIGREEIDKKFEEATQKRLEESPIVVKDFMISINNVSATTRNVYLGYVLNFIEFLTSNNGIDGSNYDDFKNIKKIDIDKYMESIKINHETGKQNGASNRNSKLAAIKNFFEFLIDNGVISKNPCEKVKKIHEIKEQSVTYLTPQEVEDIKVKILTTDRSKEYEDPWKYRDYAMFVLACSTGMRKGAIRAINLEDIDLSTKQVSVVEKRNIRKTVYLNNQTCEAIKNWIVKRSVLLKGKQCDALFISNRRERMCATAFEDMVEKYTKDLGKKITPHKLRSTCAMNLYENTGDIYLVSQQLGHKNIRNTQIYAKSSEKKMREAADIMDKIYG